jgi:hypothetical protein
MNVIMLFATLISRENSLELRRTINRNGLNR